MEKDSKCDSTPHLETLIHQTLKICGKMAFASASALFRRLVNWTTVVACRHLMCSLSLPCSGRILANLVDCCCSRFGNLITCVKQRQSFRISGSLHCPPHPHSLGSRRRSRSLVLMAMGAMAARARATGRDTIFSHYGYNQYLTK